MWPIAVAFLGEALGEHLTEKEAKDRLDKFIERNPDVGWGGWVNPPTAFVDIPPRDTWR
jgi:hypothetical protein